MPVLAFRQYNLPDLYYNPQRTQPWTSNVAEAFQYENLADAGIQIKVMIVNETFTFKKYRGSNATKKSVRPLPPIGALALLTVQSTEASTHLSALYVEDYSFGDRIARNSWVWRCGPNERHYRRGSYEIFLHNPRLHITLKDKLPHDQIG